MARHKAVSKARWLASQKRLAEMWQAEDLPGRELARIEKHYFPLLARHQPNITGKSRILDLCCGPVCAARKIAGGEKFYLDPMLDTYRRTHPGKLPKGKHMPQSSEKVLETSHSFDLILCINGLDHVHNPELTMNEIERLLATEGILLVGVTVFPAIIARLYYALEHLCSPLRNEAHPYAYSLTAIERSLARHFDIVECMAIDEPCVVESRRLGSEYAFVCKSKTVAEDPPSPEKTVKS